MKDSELRAIVLKKFYDRRREGIVSVNPEDFTPSVPHEDLMAIGDQLGEIGLLDWKAAKFAGKTMRGLGKITASGIDVIETEGRTAPVEFIFPMSQNFTFNSPSNVQVGSHNSQSIIQAFSSIIEKIDSSSASEAEKVEAKSKLKAFLEHPLVTSVVGGVAGGLGGLLK